MKYLFERNQFIKDDREPWVLLENFWGRYRIGLLPVQWKFHLQMIVIIGLQIMASNLLAILTYFTIVRPATLQKQQKIRSKSKQQALGFTNIVMMGCGVVWILVALALPFLFINAVDIRSKVLRFGCILLPMIVPLKILDAMIGVDSYERRHRSQSWKQYWYYMGFLFLPKYRHRHKDDEINPNVGHPIVIPPTRSSLIQQISAVFRWYLATILMYHVVMPWQFRPFPELDHRHDGYLSGHLARCGNSYVQGIALFLSLIFSLHAVGLMCSIAGNVQVETMIFDGQRLLVSSSPSEFWGQRWNRLIHRHLKEAVYKPLRQWCGWNQSYGKPVAVLATFLTSGIIHEYVWMLLFFRTQREQEEGDECESSYDYAFGKHLIFFGWNGILLLIEAVVSKYCQGMQRTLPTDLICHLLFASAFLPVLHLFTEDLLNSGYFTQLQVALPIFTIERNVLSS